MPAAVWDTAFLGGDAHWLFHHVNILLILPTSFSHGADSAASSDTQAGADPCRALRALSVATAVVRGQQM